MIRDFIISSIFLLTTDLHAASIQRLGDVVHIEGRINFEDHIIFERAIQAGGIKRITLDSGGGDIYTAFRIARQVRRLHLSTFLDAKVARCQSACTLIFGAGVQRYYVNAESLSDGLRDKSRFGLGYHQGNSPSLDGSRVQSERATNKMIHGLTEFGSAQAIPFVKKADSKSIFIVSGPTALSKGLATKLNLHD